MMMRNQVLATVVAAGFAAVLPAAGAPQGATRAAPPPASGTAPAAPRPDDIASRLLGIVRTLADPKWEGRGVGTAGLDSAARFVAFPSAS